MWKDPIVEEVRKIRLEIEKECGENSEELLRHAITIQNKFSDRLVSKSDHLQKKSLKDAKSSRISKHGKIETQRSKSTGRA